MFAEEGAQVMVTDVNTPGGEEAVAALPGDAEQARAQLRDDYPLGRLGEPDEIADCILFLASDWASWVTGHGLVVDGGYATT